MEGVIVAKIEPIGMERLEGTQTFENINRALMDEAISVVRYLIYADEAEDAMVEKFFKQTADNEMEHAKVMLKLLGALGEETDNLKKSFSIEALRCSIDPTFSNTFSLAYTSVISEFIDTIKLEVDSIALFNSRISDSTLLFSFS